MCELVQKGANPIFRCPTAYCTCTEQVLALLQHDTSRLQYVVCVAAGNLRTNTARSLQSQYRTCMSCNFLRDGSQVPRLIIFGKYRTIIVFAATRGEKTIIRTSPSTLYPLYSFIVNTVLEVHRTQAASNQIPENSI